MFVQSIYLDIVFEVSKLSSKVIFLYRLSLKIICNKKSIVDSDRDYVYHNSVYFTRLYVIIITGRTVHLY